MLLNLLYTLKWSQSKSVRIDVLQSIRYAGWFSFQYNDNLILELGTVRSHSLTMDKPNWIMYLTYIVQQCHIYSYSYTVYCYIVKMCCYCRCFLFRYFIFNVSACLYVRRVFAQYVFVQSLLKHSESVIDLCSSSILLANDGSLLENIFNCLYVPWNYIAHIENWKFNFTLLCDPQWKLDLFCFFACFLACFLTAKLSKH